MRHVYKILFGGLILLTVSCGLIVKSDQNRELYPLESTVGYHIGPAIHQDSRRSLFIWTTKAFPTACNEILGTFRYYGKSRQLIYTVDKLVAMKGGCSAVLTTAFDEWPFPDLMPGQYTLELKLKYSGGYTVRDCYTIDVIDSDSLVVTAVEPDSSAYYAGEIDWWM